MTDHAKALLDKLCQDIVCTFDKGCGCLEAINAALDGERERCAKTADDWLAAYGQRKPEFVTAQKWAGDAVRDIADAIRAQKSVAQSKRLMT